MPNHTLLVVLGFSLVTNATSFADEPKFVGMMPPGTTLRNKEWLFAKNNKSNTYKITVGPDGSLELFENDTRTWSSLKNQYINLQYNADLKFKDADPDTVGFYLDMDGFAGLKGIKRTKASHSSNQTPTWIWRFSKQTPGASLLLNSSGDLLYLSPSTGNLSSLITGMTLVQGVRPAPPAPPAPPDPDAPVANDGWGF